MSLLQKKVAERLSYNTKKMMDLKITKKRMQRNYWKKTLSGLGMRDMEMKETMALWIVIAIRSWTEISG